MCLIIILLTLSFCTLRTVYGCLSSSLTFRSFLNGEYILLWFFVQFLCIYLFIHICTLEYIYLTTWYTTIKCNQKNKKQVTKKIVGSFLTSYNKRVIYIQQIHTHRHHTIQLFVFRINFLLSVIIFFIYHKIMLKILSK